MVSLPAGRETWDKSQSGAASCDRLSCTLEARRPKYSERARILSGMLASASILGKMGAAQAETAKADVRNSETRIAVAGLL